MHSGRPAKSESLMQLQQSPSLTMMICLELMLVIFETPFLNFTLLCLRPLAQYRRPILLKNIYLVLLLLSPNYLLHLIQLRRGVVSAASVRPGRYFNRLLQPQAHCQFLLMTMKKFEVMILMNPYHQPSDRLSGRQSGPSVICLDSFANILVFPVIIQTTSSVPKTLPMHPFHPPMTQAYRIPLFEMDHPWQRMQHLAKKLPCTFLSRTPPHMVDGLDVVRLCYEVDRRGYKVG